MNNTRKEEAAFTRIPADLSRPPLRSARLTLRRASLQVGHATTHRSTLGMSLSLRLAHLRASPFPPSTTTTGHVARYRHYHRRAPESPPPECHSTFSFAAVRLPRLSRHPSPPEDNSPGLSLSLSLSSPSLLAASLAMPLPCLTTRLPSSFASSNFSSFFVDHSVSLLYSSSGQVERLLELSLRAHVSLSLSLSAPFVQLRWNASSFQDLPIVLHLRVARAIEKKNMCFPNE